MAVRITLLPPAAPTVTTRRIERRNSRSPRMTIAWRIDFVSSENPNRGEFRYRNRH